MALTVWATQNAVDTTGTGTTNFTHGTVTNTPVAALHFLAGATTNGGTPSGARCSVGMTDGTDQRYVSINSVHNISTNTDTHRYNNTDACIAQMFSGGPTLDGAMSHDAFISGGQRLNNDNGFGTGYLCNSLFFDCDNAKVLTATINATVDTVVNVDPGFAWDALICISVADNSVAGSTNAEFSFGFFDRTNQGCLMFNSENGDTTSGGDVGLQVRNDSVAGELALGTGNLDYRVEAAVGTGTSCDLTPRNNGGDTDLVYCLFLGWSTAETVEVVSWDSPTTTGNNADTSAGIEPQAVIHLFSFAGAYNTAEADGDAGAFGIGIETADDQFCTGYADEQGANPTDTQSSNNNKSIFVEEDDGTAGYEGTLTSLDATGWTHNWTATQVAANKLMSLAFSASGDDAGALGGVNRGVARGVMRGVG